MRPVKRTQLARQLRPPGPFNKLTRYQPIQGYLLSIYAKLHDATHRNQAHNGQFCTPSTGLTESLCDTDQADIALYLVESDRDAADWTAAHSSARSRIIG